MEDILIFATWLQVHSNSLDLNPVHQLSALYMDFPVGNKYDNCLALPITSTYKEFQERMDFAIKHSKIRKRRKFSISILTLPVLNKGMLLLKAAVDTFVLESFHHHFEQT